jgi:hypothetical protein
MVLVISHILLPITYNHSSYYFLLPHIAYLSWCITIVSMGDSPLLRNCLYLSNNRNSSFPGSSQRLSETLPAPLRPREGLGKLLSQSSKEMLRKLSAHGI